MIKNLVSYSIVFLLLLPVAFGQQPKLILPIGHTYAISSAVFSPDNKKLLTAAGDNTAKIWDAVSGTMIADLRGHTKKLVTAEFSPDGKKIVTASDDHISKIWDAITGTLIADLRGHSQKLSVAHFSPDGKKILTASGDSTAKIWDASSGKIIIELKGHLAEVNGASFSPDGKKISTASSDNTIRIWDASFGKFITELKGHTKKISSAQFSPDGKSIVSASDDNTAKIWDINTGYLKADLIGHTKRINSASFSLDGKKIITACDDMTAKIWDASTGILLKDLKAHSQVINSACFSPDGKKVVSSSKDSTAKIWEVTTGILLAELRGHSYFVNSAQFSPDGKKIVTTSSDATAKIWEAASGNLIVDLKGHTFLVMSAEYSPDGKKIFTASADYTPKIWDDSTGKLLADMKGRPIALSMAQFSPDGKTLLIPSRDHTTKIYARNGALIGELKGHRSWVTSAHYSPDGKKIVTSSGDSTARIWDAITATVIADLRGHTSYVFSAVFSPDGKKIITASADSTAKLWDADSGKLITDLLGHTDDIFTAQFSPDGKKIVTSSSDYTAKIWDATTGKLLNDLKGHTHWVRSANFSPDGKTVVTASSDHSTKKWNASTGDIIYSFYALDNSDYLIVDALNHYDGTDGARKLIYFTCGTEVIELDQLKDQLWVPNLAERLNNGETISAKTLDELNICGLTPEVENASSKPGEYFFKIFPRRGGLGETVLSINGTPTKTYKRDQLKKTGGVYELLIKKEELSLYFIPGKENLVTLKAYTSDNSISSRIVKFSEASTQPVFSAPNLYAVIVGISDYKGDDLDLKYASKDATDISAAVAGAARKLLNTDNKEHVFMYNFTTAAERYQLPEKKSIKKILEDIGRKATANDILLIFFAGHGLMDDQKKQFYFLTADASRASALDAVGDVSISTAELTEWMKPQNIKAQKRILIFDACNSGQAIRDFIKIGKDDQGYVAARGDEKAQQIRAIDKLNEKTGLFILSASASNQRAYEMGRYSQGILTYALLKAIKQQPDILEDGKYLNLSRWFNAAEKTVTELSEETGARQQPQIVSNTNFNIGIVDDEVISKIRLSSEKPLFGASNFLNGDENIADDNLELSKAVNSQLDEFSKEKNSQIMFINVTNSSDAYQLSGRYDVKENELAVKINIKQGKEIKHKFEVKGTATDTKLLAKKIVQEATEWVGKKK